jgi:RNA polymerase sigma-70 factor (ECF subfamily)
MAAGVAVLPEIASGSGWFEEAVRRHYRLVFSVALSALGRPGDAEDAAQEAFLRAYRARAQLEKCGSVASWLASIARNAAIDLARRRGREKAARESEAASPAAAGLREEKGARERPDVRAEAADEKARVRAAVADLPAHEAEVVLLRFVEGLPAAEIAARLGIEPVTVRTRLHRAIRHLRAVLDPGGEEGPGARRDGGDRAGDGDGGGGAEGGGGARSAAAGGARGAGHGAGSEGTRA